MRSRFTLRRNNVADVTRAIGVTHAQPLPEDTPMPTLAEYWKSILAFLSLFATNLVADWMANGQPWPENWAAFARWIVSIGAGTFLVYRKANAPATGRHAKPE